MSFDTPIFFGATVLGVLVLLGIGVLVSACVWVIVQAAREQLGWTSPLSDRQKLAIRWGALGVGLLFGLVFFPVATAGVGVEWPDEEADSLVAASAVAGLVGGIGARVAHDRARQLLEATWGWLLTRIGDSDAGTE